MFPRASRQVSSQKHALVQHLPRFERVLVPRAAGFAAALGAMEWEVLRPLLRHKTAREHCAAA